MDSILSKARSLLTGYQGRPLRIMEVCGTHTHEIFRLGIRDLLPEQLTLISGPGCPVCVTAVSFIDEAIWLALEAKAVICTFGDLIRVPGSTASLADARAQGGDIRIVYTPLDAVNLAQKEPDKDFVFLSVGFETTVPVECQAILNAQKAGITNFSLLVANKTMPHAYAALAGAADVFLYPGHVCAITGTTDCRANLAQGISGVIAGFTATEIVTALAVSVSLAEKGEPFFRNCYPRVVSDEGNPRALAILAQVMEACDAEWRGLGIIPQSGLKLREAYSDFDARKKLSVPHIEGRANQVCRCGEVLQGHCRPDQCPVFGKGCTPAHPIGACMVSHEGACAAYFMYKGATK